MYYVFIGKETIQNSESLVYYSEKSVLPMDRSSRLIVVSSRSLVNVDLPSPTFLLFFI